MLPRETSYIILFLILSLTGLGVVAWVEARQAVADSFAETVRAILSGMESVVVASGAFTYILIEGWKMLAERYEKRRYLEGRAEGLVEGRTEGLAEGHAKGQDTVLALLDEDTRREVERKLRRNGNDSGAPRD